MFSPQVLSARISHPKEKIMATVPKPIVTDEQLIREVAQEFVRYHEERNI
jgi:hypothetical protein